LFFFHCIVSRLSSTSEEDIPSSDSPELLQNHPLDLPKQMNSPMTKQNKNEETLIKIIAKVDSEFGVGLGVGVGTGTSVTATAPMSAACGVVVNCKGDVKA
jgi:hypothetical protein